MHKAAQLARMCVRGRTESMLISVASRNLSCPHFHVYDVVRQEERQSKQFRLHSRRSCVLEANHQKALQDDCTMGDTWPGRKCDLETAGWE